MIHYKGIAILLVVMVLASFQTLFAADRGSITISDREIIERLTRLEQGQKGIENQINGIQHQINGIQNQFSGLQDQINGLRNLILGGFGVIFAGMFSLIGFVIRDRGLLSPLSSTGRVRWSKDSC